MALKIYNTLTKKKEVFKPMRGKEVGYYECGPTIYDFAHIGNFRAYLMGDVLRRYLEYQGFKVKHIMNLTDVDDKTIRDSQKEGVSLKEFTETYERAFLEDMSALNIETPQVITKATEYIKEMVELVKKLLEKGIAYKAEEGSIYYNISKFPHYGKLSGVELKKLKAGARVKQDEYGKDNVQDFALWKAWNKSDGDVYWETDLGKGRPGWHIECSTMSMKLLGESFDIHTGGTDLVFPHHENEIAQSEGATDKPFVKYWVHNEWLLVDGKKMAKSFGNFYTLRDIISKGYSPLAVRYLLISAHYRTQLNFTEENLKDSVTTVNRLLEFMEKLQELQEKGVTGNFNKDLQKELEETSRKFEEAMDDDLNMPIALASIHEFITKANKAIAEEEVSIENIDNVYWQMIGFDKVLGILEHEKAEAPKEIKELVEKRENARAGKDFKASDEIREKIRKLGWEVQDTSDGPRVIKRI